MWRFIGMKRKIVCFSTVLFFTLMIKVLVKFLLPVNSNEIYISLYNDAESRMAHGEQILYPSSHPLDLAFAPGISDTLAGRIHLAFQGNCFSGDNVREVLMTVKGIGPKTAEKILQYINFSCQKEPE